MPTIPTIYDVDPLDTGERWLPIVPTDGLVPRTGLRPASGGGVTVLTDLGAGVHDIPSEEVWGGPSVIAYSADLQGIASGETWLSETGLVPHTGLYPSDGLYPHGSGLTWEYLFDLDGLASLETWGDPLGVSLFAARVFLTATLASHLPLEVELDT